METEANSKNGMTYTLKQIADWQLKTGSPDVVLPHLQRGFVWKPFQTENLWDSLLRRFPLGTFILAPSQNNHPQRLELLDGQQRATAITFGFFDPWTIDSSRVSLWRIQDTANIPILWLDLRPPDSNAEIKFVFRLLTRSQPWGYQRKEHQEPLTAEDRRKFLSRLAESLTKGDREKRYLDLPLTHFWPWDAKLPVPFAFLLKSCKHDDWKPRLRALCSKFFPALKTKHPSTGGAYPEQIKEFLDRPYAEDLRKRISDGIESTQVPVLNMPRDVLEEVASRPSHSNNEDEIPDDIETLFVRINSAGTPLAGEELIYSIYKSIFPETIDLVEKAGAGFILPSRLVSLATRIVQADIQRERMRKNHKGTTDKLSLPPKVRVKDFRRQIYKRGSGFKGRLQTFVSSLTNNNVFLKAQSILSGKYDFQLPPALAVDLAKRSPEIVFILIYRLYLGDNIKIGSEEHRKILGFLTALSWFGRGENLRDHDQCLRHLWRDLLTLDGKAFWHKKVMRKTTQPWNDKFVMLPLLAPSWLAKFVEHQIIKKGKAWDDIDDPAGNSYIAQWYKAYYQSRTATHLASNTWRKFLDKLGDQRGLVLFAQRAFVNRCFPDFNHLGVQNLEDSHCPWDWDHIHAQQLIARKWNVDLALKEWHSTIGNLRIWPMELNRSDSDRAPSDKLTYEADNDPFLIKYGLKSCGDLLRASFISDNEPFAELDGDCDITKKSTARKIRQAILMRMVSLYRHWYDELRLVEYFPQ